MLPRRRSLPASPGQRRSGPAADTLRRLDHLSPEEPLSHLARIPIRECGEPLVDFLEACPSLLLDRPRYDYPRSTLLRSGVVKRLARAVDLLPPGYRLSIIEGWRSPEAQLLQYRQTEERLRKEHPHWPLSTLRRAVNRISAPPSGPAPPPHSTGGAVDVWLCDELGEPLDLSGPFAPENPRSFRLLAPGFAPEVQERRTLLRTVLETAGLSNYPSEYWHWSYGDQGWAYRGRRPFAIYGEVSGYVSV